MPRFCAIDFESAGARPGQTDVPVQIGLAYGDWGAWLAQPAPPGTLAAPPALFSSYIQPEQPILWSAAKVHGITDDQVANAPAFRDLWPAIGPVLTGGTLLIGHNIGTEKRFLRAFPGAKFGPWLDSLRLMRRIYPSHKNGSLEACCHALGLEPSLHAWLPHGRWHDATFDAAASLAIILHLARNLDLGPNPLATLQRL